jgi:phospholipase C
MRLAVLLTLVGACGSDARKAGSCDGPCPASKVNHLVVLVQENHTFDTYFGRYCTAAAGSAPTCTSGPGCCEAGPDHDPSGAAPMVLDDTLSAAHDPDHTQACELDETHGGLMDRYVTGSTCSDPRNFAYADPSVLAPYTQLAGAGALADRYFQPIAGQSSSNDMYLVRAQYVFTDNAYKPDAIGQDCSVVAQAMSFPGPTIGDLLDTASVSWAFYVEGYQAMIDAHAQGHCPTAPTDCPFGIGLYPCVFDPSDIPMDYYANLADDPRVLRDYAQFAKDLADSTLPQVVFVRGLGYHSEHPGYGDTISDGVRFTSSVVDAVKASPYAPDTLVLITWDEGGGFFDHVSPPAPGSDGQPYGTRVPLVVTGPFARAGSISHVMMEHSSIVKFIEWNWLAMQTGQLAGRDANVANLGSLLDPATTGTAVPE